MIEIKRVKLSADVIDLCLNHIMGSKPIDYSGLGYNEVTGNISLKHKELKLENLEIADIQDNTVISSFPDVILGNYAKFGMVKLFVINATILRLLYSKSALPKNSIIFKQTNGVLRPYMLTSINFYDGGFWTFGHND